MAITPASPPGSSGSGPSGPSGPSRPFPPRPSRGPRPFAPNKDEHRLNERIRVPQVRLIDDEGNQVGIVPTHEALRMAREKGLDLMEISPNAHPPVCKITDYGKFKYEKKKKEAQARKKQTVIKVKEIQLRPQTDTHDLDYKFKNARSFLEDGAKVKVSIMFRGREVAFAANGYSMMKQLAEKVADIAAIESPAKLEGKKMIMILAPATAKKPGAAPAKMGPKPVVVKAASSSAEESGSDES